MTNKDYRIVTAPVLIPGQPDCDYHNGEPPLTTEQIKQLMNTYREYQIIDKDHQYMFDGKWYKRNIGTPLKWWQNKKTVTYTDVFDVERTVPSDTWWLSSKVPNI